MWPTLLNRAISTHNSSSSASPMAGTRLSAPNFPDMSFGRSSSSERAPDSSNSFMMGLRAWTKASALLFGTRYMKTEQYAIGPVSPAGLRVLFSLNSSPASGFSFAKPPDSELANSLLRFHGIIPASPGPGHG